MADLFESLNILCFSVKNEIISLNNGNKLPTVQFRSHEAVTYHYDMIIGLKNCFFNTKIVLKFDIANSIPIIMDLIRDTKEYKDASNKLSIFLDDNNVSFDSKRSLDSLIKKLIRSILSGIEKPIDFNFNTLNLQFENKKIEILINMFLNELLGNLTETQLEMELSGIVLRFNRIVIEDMEIRRPTKNDLKKVYLRDPKLEYGGISEIPTHPSAIMCLKFFEDTNRFDPVINFVDTSKFILRMLNLFKVGDIKCLNFKVKTDSILKSEFYWMFDNIPGFSNGVLNYINSSLNLHFPIYLGDSPDQKRYILTSSFARHLYDFKGIIEPKMGKMFSYETIYLMVAYEHYLNALMQHHDVSDNYFIEKRITETIMGLESLYLTEHAELSYRVKIRLSKIFHILSKNEPLRFKELLMNIYSPEKIYKRIEQGYEIRNQFAHGARPSSKKLDRIDRKLKEIDAEYNGLEDLLTNLIEYLRISIVLFLFIDKNEFIDLIDSTLINSENEDKLNTALSGINSQILLNNIDLTTDQVITWIKYKNKFKSDRPNSQYFVAY